MEGRLRLFLLLFVPLRLWPASLKVTDAVETLAEFGRAQLLLLEKLYFLEVVVSVLLPGLPVGSQARACYSCILLLLKRIR